MVGYEALGVAGARISLSAWIDAVFVVAGLVVRAVVVRVAFGSLALDERITFESWWTFASRSVVAAVAGRRNRARIIDRARIDALSVVAGFVVGTLRVRLAAELHATKLWIAGVARFASAHWEVIRDEAIGVLTAVARTHAMFVDTRLGELTLGVGSAASLRLLDGLARDFWVSNVANWTATDAVMVLSVTERSTTARVSQTARVDASAVRARSVEWTIVVVVTFSARWIARYQRALDVRISLVFR